MKHLRTEVAGSRKKRQGRLAHKPAALAWRQRPELCPFGLELPTPRPPDVYEQSWLSARGYKTILPKVSFYIEATRPDDIFLP